MPPEDPVRAQPQLRALVSLLSDENGRIVAEARRALCGHGEAALLHLDFAIASGDAKLRARARIAREEVRLALLERRLREIAARIEADEGALEEGAILLSQSRDPELEATTVRAALDAMADDFAGRMSLRDAPATTLEKFARFLAVELGFQGNARNYYDPDNSYLNRVLERRTGIPITLCSVYLFVARRLGIPLVGVGMPGHFVLRHAAIEPPLFLDPFHGGRLLCEEDCVRRLEEGRFGSDTTWLLPTSDGAMLVRMIRNLLLIYRNRGDSVREAQLRRLKQVLVGDEVAGPELNADGDR